jgi:hypothetical protein
MAMRRTLLLKRWSVSQAFAAGLLSRRAAIIGAENARGRFHELPAMERRAGAGEVVHLDAVTASLAARCAAAARDPELAGPSDEWLAAGNSAVRLVEHSGGTVDSRLGRVLHEVLVRGGAIEESVQLLSFAVQAGTLQESEARSITAKSLKHLLSVRSGGQSNEPALTAREDGHWDLLRALQDHGLACHRHHTQVLHACESREEVHRVLRGMKASGIVRVVCLLRASC